jgi:hypothetical protein
LILGNGSDVEKQNHQIAPLAQPFLRISFPKWANSREGIRGFLAGRKRVDPKGDLWQSVLESTGKFANFGRRTERVWV